MPVQPPPTTQPHRQPSPILGRLPQIVRVHTGEFVRPRENPQAFIENELNVDILDSLARWLWLAGRLDSIRPLHHQRLLGREIVLTERAKAHLLWTENRIFLKPLPFWLLDASYVRANTVVPNQPRILEQATGFLRSYVLLIQYETDFKLAHDLRLLPEALTWEDWLQVVADNAHLTVEGKHTRSPRYQYGELRLYRVNLLYRLLPPFRPERFFRGYLYGHANYKGFVQRNFAWLLVVFVYITIILTAMQLGLATAELSDSADFHRASYGFAVFSILLPLAVILYVLVLSGVMVVYNVSAALAHVREEGLARKKTVHALQKDPA